MELRECFLCGKNGQGDPLEEHHLFGASNRDKSTKHNLTVYLCGSECHREGKRSAHRCKDTALYLKRYGQRVYMSEHGVGIDEFISEFGRSYL